MPGRPKVATGHSTLNTPNSKPRKMKFNITLAGTVIEINHRHDFISSLCKDYLAPDDAVPAFSVYVSDEQMAKEKFECENGPEPHRFPDYIYESTCIHRAVASGMVKYGVILIHSAVVAVDGKAYAFLAKSGTGKSTHIEQWLNRFKEKATVINADKPMFSFSNDRLIVHGSPWRGKEMLGVNESVPVKALCILERGEKNEIRPATQSEVISKLFHQILLPENEAELALFMSIINRIVCEVPFYLLKCTISPDAASVAYEGMNSEKQ